MPRAIIASPRAELQLMDILAYLNRRNPLAGRRFTERVEAAYRQLSNFPLSGARGQATGTRRLILAPYVLTYREVGTEVIEIIDIRHGRQRPPSPPGDV
jgi:plasmid stabilization system protein ParE